MPIVARFAAISRHANVGGDPAHAAHRFALALVDGRDRPTAVIYDFGANDGSNLKYYLTKDRVVAVEANPQLCHQIARAFAQPIAEKRLFLLNVVLGAEASSEPVIFYVHRTNDLLSQLSPPSDPRQFEAIEVPCRTPASIIQEYGDPAYVKVDVEGHDGAVLRNLFDAGIMPDEISAEAHSVEVFGLMIARGYKAFCLIEGFSVAKRFPGFAPHSAGPFGDDIGARWEDADTFLTTLSAEGLGWKDIHASRTRQPVPRPSGSKLALRLITSLARRATRKLERIVA